EADRLIRHVAERVAEVTEDGPEFFDALLLFRLTARGVAQTPAERERESAAAVAAIRGRILATGDDRWTVRASPDDPLRARAVYDEAVAASRRLVEDFPKNEQLRLDLAAGRVAAGDVFAAAGRLAEAVRVWDEGLAVLEDAVRANPVGVPARTALAAQSLHVGNQLGGVGLWGRAAGHYRRAFEVQPP